ncbi:hypothetical protein VTN00DRAFT_2404 [Thermoascus crustaceus]|uniref:uncharacterized protein n=1 Tax=Thermoascus crustaceus TaxID=5088 RepID=UPI003742DB08
MFTVTQDFSLSSIFLTYLHFDLLEKRSNKYSSRPRFIVMGELYWDNAGILIQPYGKAWQIRRRLLHQALNPSALRLCKSVQEAEASPLVYSLLCNPASYEAFIDRLTASVAFSIAYRHRIDSMNSKIIRQRLEFMQYAASLNIPGRFLVETLPVLKYIPNCLAPWKAEIQDRGRVEAAVNMALVRQVQEDIKRAKHPSDIPDSLTKILLEARADDPVAFSLLSDRDFAFVPASLFGAGSDTTASTLCSAVLMLVTNPVTLQAAHAELDAVVGSARSPTFTDDAKLPYIKALCAEILRIRPVAVLGGTPHANSASDMYKGYYIPKRTTVLSNSWAINLNPTYYPNPHHFNPLRFLPDSTPPESLPYMPRSYITSTPQEKSTTPHPSKDGHSSFGWGRRVCPGAGLAQNSLFIALAKLLWAYDVLPVREEDGSERTYDRFAYTEGFNVRPRPFECVIRVRSEAHRAVLEREMGETAEVL